MSLTVIGTGTALPRHSLSQEEAVVVAKRLTRADDRQTRRLEKLYRLTGVKRRHTVVLDNPLANDAPIPLYPDARSHDDQGPPLTPRMERYEREAPRLAEDAARAALADAQLAPADISHIVTVTCSGFMSPGIDVFLMDSLGLPPTVQRTQVGFMGCHGALNGLRVAKGYAESDPGARVLLVAVELCSLHYQYGWDDERNVANALFADGAAAMVLGGDTSRGDVWRGTHTGSCLIPASRDAMSWRIRDNGFVMTLSATVPELIEQHLRPWLDPWLAQRHLTCNDVSSWAVHPGGPAILKAVQKTLGIQRRDLAVSWETLSTLGNMSSPTVLFILQTLIQHGAPRPCVALGFGPGLMVEAMLFE